MVIWFFKDLKNNPILGFRNPMMNGYEMRAGFGYLGNWV
jgi:hypothetical protein